MRAFNDQLNEQIEGFRTDIGQQHQLEEKVSVCSLRFFSTDNTNLRLIDVGPVSELI